MKYDIIEMKLMLKIFIAYNKTLYMIDDNENHEPTSIIRIIDNEMIN
jgi:hypothetical protein